MVLRVNVHQPSSVGAPRNGGTVESEGSVHAAANEKEQLNEERIPPACPAWLLPHGFGDGSNLVWTGCTSAATP